MVIPTQILISFKNSFTKTKLNSKRRKSGILVIPFYLQAVYTAFMSAPMLRLASLVTVTDLNVHIKVNSNKIF